MIFFEKNIYVFFTFNPLKIENQKIENEGDVDEYYPIRTICGIHEFCTHN